MDRMNEQCWVLIGTYSELDRLWRVKRRRQIGGSRTSVEADWAWTLAHEEQHGDVIGFWHTHPRGYGTIPSGRDVLTMRAWCSAFGKPLLCVIADGDNWDGYVFVDDESEWQPVRSIERIKPGQFVMMMGEKNFS